MDLGQEEGDVWEARATQSSSDYVQLTRHAHASICPCGLVVEEDEHQIPSLVLVLQNRTLPAPELVA